jgi:acyl-CoA synthetase (AMP-forming)/AMP-acid ligase II
MVHDAGVTLVVSVDTIRTRGALLESAVPELRGIDWLTVEDVAAATSSSTTLPDVNADDVALLQYTSGSTSSPRGVMVTHGNLLDNLACGARLGAYDADSIGVSWLPVNHDMGLIGGILQPAYSGFPLWLMSPAAFLQRPARWLQAISRLRATHSGAPNFAYELCARRVSDDDRRVMDLSCWRVAFSGSEPIRHGTLTSFQRAFGETGFRWEALTPAYGLAESTLLVSGSTSVDGPASVDLDRDALRRGLISVAPPSTAAISIVSCGPASDLARIVVVDPVRRQRCAAGSIGEIWIAGPSVARGYWNRPDETKATFHAFLDAPDDGPFLRTGDLGFLHGGSVFITGRLKDVLIVRGMKHYPQDLELTAERADEGIRAGCVAGFAIDVPGKPGESVVIVAELDLRERQTDGGDEKCAAHQHVLTAIRRDVADEHNITLAAIVLVSAGTLPRTTSGKLQRFLCREAYLDGTLDVITHWAAPDAPSPIALRRAS